jgi:protein involved in polysaccharide export with SLBB domain
LAGVPALLGACLLSAGWHIAINLPQPTNSEPAPAPTPPAGGQGPVASRGLQPKEGSLRPVAAANEPGGVVQAKGVDFPTVMPSQPVPPEPAPALAQPAGPLADVPGAGFAVGPEAPAPAGGDEHAGCGCHHGGACGGHGGGSPYGPIPRELDKVSLPDYVIEPPDILVIDTVRGAPLPPYHIEPLDVLQIQVSDTLPNEAIAGLFVVEPEGTVNLGLSYGSVPVAGLTLEAARAAINAQLKRVLTNPRAVVALAQTRGIQQLVRGEHLVRPDGTISLGVYGCVYVAGLNLCQAREVIEQSLSRFLKDPQISLDVLGFNSKVYYIIFDGGGYGQQVYRLPVTGNETVLDAIGLVNGLPAVASKKKIWVARPAPCENGCDQVLPVDWMAIVQGGSTATNYQLLPGDRIYVKADPWIAIDNNLAKVLAPFERLMGFTLLTESVIQNARTNNNNGGFGFVGVVR